MRAELTIECHLPSGLMLYVGALLIAKGRYDFPKMLQVFALILFAVTFAGQLMGYRKSLPRLFVILSSG